MRVAFATAFVLAATWLASSASPPAAAHSRGGPWCIVKNDGKATWHCYPTHTLCRRFGEVPDTALSCVQNPAWSGRG